MRRGFVRSCSIYKRGSSKCAAFRLHAVHGACHLIAVPWLSSPPQPSNMLSSLVCKSGGQARQKLQLHDEKVERLLQQNYSCTGFGFVTFDSEAAVSACMDAINNRKVEFNGRSSHSRCSSSLSWLLPLSTPFPEL